MKVIAIVGIRYRNYAHYTLYRSCLPIYGIAINRSLSLLFLDDFEGNANISVAIKSGSTVIAIATGHTTLTGASNQNVNRDIYGITLSNLMYCQGLKSGYKL